MDSFAENPSSSSAGTQPFIARVPVLGVVIAAAFALGAASVMSGYPMGGPPLFATLAAVSGGVVWLYAPRIGYWILLVSGLVIMTASGIALARGAVPWLLVAFWGGSALLLAAILHLTTGAGRSSTVTLVAVISLLALSALGLGQYVRATWTPDERAILERLPKLVVAPAATPVWTDAPAPAPDGAWRCAWVVSVTRSEALRTVRGVLVRDGWIIRTFSTTGMSAEKAGDRVDLTLSDSLGPAPLTPGGTRVSGTQFTAIVQDVEPTNTP
jgi:uncharacterized membrane protein SirB2